MDIEHSDFEVGIHNIGYEQSDPEMNIHAMDIEHSDSEMNIHDSRYILGYNHRYIQE